MMRCAAVRKFAMNSHPAAGQFHGSVRTQYQPL
jgi:hypothetical protein